MATWKEISLWKYTDISFMNDGQKYDVTLRIDKEGNKSASLGGGKHPHIYEYDIVGAELIEEKSLIFKKYFIIVKKKQWTRGNTEILEKRIAVKSNEKKDAELVVSHLNDIIQQKKKKNE